MEKDRTTFSSKLGYVLSAAASAVGLGNIWRFPYLAARYGGGAFLLVYILLAVTFGYTMIVSETAIGRASGKSPIGAFRFFGMKRGGWINAIIPVLIVPYYSVIGGWVLKYLFNFIVTDLNTVTDPSFFPAFISDGFQSELWFVIFSLSVLVIILLGVQGGIEKVSKLMMPVLVLLAAFISIYVLFQPGALKGVKYLFVPDFKNFSIMTVVAAMGQMFYSLSIAMGILITFGSYMKKDFGIESATLHVEIFDTVIAILSGLMIIPAVFAFSGGDPEALNAGPSLMFVTMPRIFASMRLGRLIGILFFILVFFAALTSAIALLESAVSTFTDELSWSRKKATLVMGLIMLVLGSLSSQGYGVLSGVKIIGMQFLDFFDFLTNSLMMPIAAMFICICVVKYMGIDRLEKEVMLQGQPFTRRAMYRIMIRHICPVFILVILVSSVLSAFGIITY